MSSGPRPAPAQEPALRPHTRTRARAAAQQLGLTRRAATAAPAKRPAATALGQRGGKGISESRGSAVIRVKYL